MKSFVRGDFSKYFGPINYIKSYYGEKYALEFSFLLHYQAWLVFPAVLGTFIFLYQVIMVAKNGIESFDSSLSFVFGIFTALWSAAFIESWKKTERIIIYYWAVDQKMLKSDDERKNEFNYNVVYNNISFNKQKKKVEPKIFWVLFYKALALLALFAVIGSMIVYIYLNGYFQMKGSSIEEGEKGSSDMK